jgi:hypothetical protein
MTTDEIRRLHRMQPFEPYRILVADGRYFDVRHPESLSMMGKGRLINIGMRDHFVTLDLPLVTGAQQPIPRRGRNGNGSAKRQK